MGGSEQSVSTSEGTRSQYASEQLADASAASHESPTKEECNWAAYAHQTLCWMWVVYLWFGALVATTILLELYKSRSRYVTYHARQALYLQLVIIAMIGPAWLTSKFINLSDLPPVVQMLLGGWTIGGIVILIAAMIGSLTAWQRTREGSDFHYWIVGRWARAKERTSREPVNQEPLN